MAIDSVPKVVAATYVKLPPVKKLLTWTLSFYGKHWTTLVGVAFAPIVFSTLAVVIPESTPVVSLILINILTSIAASFAYIGLMVAVVEAGAPGGIGETYVKALRQWVLLALTWTVSRSSRAWRGIFICLSGCGGRSLTLFCRFCISDRASSWDVSTHEKLVLRQRIRRERVLAVLRLDAAYHGSQSSGYSCH